MTNMEMKRLNKDEPNQNTEDENIENIQKIQEAFNCFDKNKSGRIPTRVKIELIMDKWNSTKKGLEVFKAVLKHDRLFSRCF